MNDHRKSYLLLHISVVLWGFTAVLGDLISLSAVILVWWRVGLTSFGLLFLKKVLIGLKKVSRADFIKFSLIGCVIAMHWICFYGSVKLANASVALIAVSTTAFFTSFMEPLITKQPIDYRDILFGIAVIPGVVLVAGGLNDGMIWGLIVGFGAALLAALFAILNKKYIKRATPYTITFIEMFGAWLFMNMIIIIMHVNHSLTNFWPTDSDWTLLIILCVLCTIVPFIMHLVALEHISAFATNLIVNLEPVYGIILAFAILKEYQELSWSFYLGGLMIMSTVLLYPLIKPKIKVDSLPIGN